ncbi:MAG: methionyl-tRNA formyltransferase [Tepidiformaceae bacterium]
MRVSIMGQAAFGEAVLKRLLEDGIEVVGVSAPEPKAGGRADALWTAAEAAGLPQLATSSLKSAEGTTQWGKFGADLCVMAFVTDIVSDEALNVPRLGSIQYHPSILPLHRGSSAMNWAIINGDPETGLSIFWTARGIDTGPIVLQKRCAIGPSDTVGSLYFEKLFPMGVDAVSEAVAMVAAGNARRIEQDHALSTYEPPCADVHAEIRWYEPAERVSALIRGCNPAPGAWTMFEGEKLRIFDIALSGDQEPGMPGRVLRISDAGIDVRLNGGVMRVGRVQASGQKKTPAGEWAEAAGLREGFRFR